MTISPWTDTMIARLKSLWLDGKTAADIAQALGPDISRSAVLGKIHRLKLARDRPRTGVTTRPAAEAPGWGRRRAQSPGETSPRPDDASVQDETAEPCRASILSVRRFECRWAIGEPGTAGFRLCGLPVTRGAFCASHAAMGYRPTPETPRSLERLARLA